MMFQSVMMEYPLVNPRTTRVTLPKYPAAVFGTCPQWLRIIAFLVLYLRMPLHGIGYQEIFSVSSSDHNAHNYMVRDET